MKKIYFILSLAVMALLSSCSEDYNENNFPGYKDAATPTNVATYNYALIDADYKTISNSALAIAKTKADSTIASAIATNKFFLDAAPGTTYIPLLLAKKYTYADAKSSAMITYNKSVEYDTTKMATADKYSLLTADYDYMGTATNQPGKYDNFSSSINPYTYIPVWLKLSKYPFAKAGDVKLIRYKYYVSSKVTNAISDVFVFDGTNWTKYQPTNPVTEKFSFKDGKWQFVNSEVFVEKFTKDFGTFTPVIVTGTYTWTWANYNGGCAVANAYQKGATEIWLVSPVIDLNERVKPTLSFDYALNYGTGLTVSNLFGVYVSTNYTTDVTKATWEKLALTYPTTFSWTFINSGKLALTKYANKKITVAFKYVSEGSAIGLEVSNVNLLDE